MILALYADNAELESPLALHLMNKEEGICRGKAELKEFFKILAKRKLKSDTSSERSTLLMGGL